MMEPFTEKGNMGEGVVWQGLDELSDDMLKRGAH